MNSRKLNGLILSVFGLIVLVALLLPSTGQLQQSGPVKIGSSLEADGWPIPPLPPPSLKPPAQPTVVADGWPLPLPPPPSPKSPAQPTLVADGWPIPPLPPPSLKSPAQPTVVADGWPLPPGPPSPKPPAICFHV